MGASGAEKGFHKRGVPKGCLAIKVGQGEEQERFVVPLMYFKHPLFMQLLKDAEEEYGFDHKGTITIPCHVEHFRNLSDDDARMNVTSSNCSFLVIVLLGIDLCPFDDSGNN
ncbi:Auxin-responsive protein SAUR32 [Glycine max]|nr:Auxin-responsive protein SAUR32 [Glycine max]